MTKDLVYICRTVIFPYVSSEAKKEKKRKQYNKMEDALAVAVTCGRLCAERNNNNRGWWMRDNLRSQLANCLMDKKNREDWASLVTSMHPALRWASPSGSRWTELSPPSPVFTFERHFRGRILHTCACLFRTRPFFLSEQLFFFYSIGSFIFLIFFFLRRAYTSAPMFHLRKVKTWVKGFPPSGPLFRLFSLEKKNTTA